jgi:hypothetical protein
VGQAAEGCVSGLRNGFGKSQGQAKGVSLETTMAKLGPYMRGWRGYLGFCETPNLLTLLVGFGDAFALRCGGNGKRNAAAGQC